MELPDRNNVYGILQCDRQLIKVAEVVVIALSLSESEIDIKTSEFDGSQKLLIRAANAEFDAYFTGVGRELLFNGAVAGPVKTVTELVQKIHDALNAAGFTPTFEIYDDSKNCVTEFNA